MASPEIEIAQLSEEQQQALQQFISVTDLEPATAVPILQRSHWNVPIAIAKFFDGESVDSVAEDLAAQNVPPPRVARQENLQDSFLSGSSASSRSGPQNDDAPRIVPQPDNQIATRPNFIIGLIFAPFSLAYRLISLAFGFISYFLPFLPRTFRPNLTAGTTRQANISGRRALKPRDAAARLKREIEEEYGGNTVPFYEGGYAQALDIAKNDLKFLLVLLTSPEHDDTSSWIREALLSGEVQSFISNPANEIILWAGDVRDSEAYQVSSALKCSKFPFTALIAHTPQQSTTSMSVLTRLTGPMPATTYIAKLQTAITTHSEQLRTVRETRNAQNFERNLRQEQDSAYERSLAQDRERARLKKEAKAQAAAEEKRAKDAAEAAANLIEKRNQWRQWRARNVIPEPSADLPDVVRIALKLPEAARIIRRFPSNSGIEELYAFTECYEILHHGSLDNTAVKPDGYEHKFDFRLVSTLPRVVYDPSDVGTIAERIGKSGNLIVETILDEDDDE
ncbi:hypothetical protein BJ878DRAFT_463516 [Calycina marina]|uniref:UBX domain-containing protein n=1 Tax=Calycina marina TaxID=1763456 RepID=A0A9P7Z043_9HELO|nr:hypothetical protein BJ878DRAFT_463516 [Calycina marina]